MDYSHLCQSEDHLWSRRQWLGTAAASTLGACGLGNLAHPLLAEQMKENSKQVLFVWDRRRHEPVRELGSQTEHPIRRSLSIDTDFRARSPYQ